MTKLENAFCEFRNGKFATLRYVIPGTQKCWVRGVPLRNCRWATNDFYSPQKVGGNKCQRNLGFGNNERVAAIYAFLGQPG